MLPSSAELRYFLQIAQSLNFSRAALNLGISQPSLSLAMKRLEETIGKPIFIRQKKGVVLTRAGKQLHMHVRKLMDDWECIKSYALASHESTQGRFTIGCNSAIAMYTASSFLPDLLKRHPQLEIHFEHGLSQHITQEVIQFNIDIGIVINPIQHPDLIILKLGTDETLFWTSKSSRIHSATTLVCNQESIQAQQLLKKCKKKGIHFNRIIHTNSLEVVANLTAHNCGIGILPERVAALLHSEELRKCSHFPMYSDELCLIYRSENRYMKAMQVIAQAIKDCF